jgi:uncharacterized protein YndB with AHSA1/START domain
MERIKQELEFLLKASPVIIYDYISNTSNLTQWFCDNLKAKSKDKYVFIWDEEERLATIEKKVRGKLIKWSWDDAPKGEYLQLEVIKDDMTGDVLVKVTDFCDEEEAESNMELWEADIEHLGSVIGAH